MVSLRGVLWGLIAFIWNVIFFYNLTNRAIIYIFSGQTTNDFRFSASNTGEKKSRFKAAFLCLILMVIFLGF